MEPKETDVRPRKCFFKVLLLYEWDEGPSCIGPAETPSLSDQAGRSALYIDGGCISPSTATVDISTHLLLYFFRVYKGPPC